MDQRKGRPVRDRVGIASVMMTILDRLAAVSGAGVDYRVVGTAAAVLQGVPAQAGDIDILVGCRADVDVMAEALSAFPCRTPATWLPDARQYFASYMVDGADVEVSTVEWPSDTDTGECVGAGPWEHFVPVECGARHVPAVRLELRLVSELVRGRQDRAAALVAHMREHGADTGLLRRAMLDRAVPPDVCGRVLDEVGGRDARPRSGPSRTPGP